MAPRRQRRASGALAALPLTFVGFLVARLTWPGLVTFAWLAPASKGGHAASEAVAAPPTRDTGRRQLWQSYAVASAAALWSSSPQDAMAFRADRILNAKKTVVPKIRLAYQKLEGLRDDLYLEVEIESGNPDSRITIPARPAEWYDGIDSKLDGPLVLVDDSLGFGCQEYNSKEGGVLLVPRGRCTFGTKMEFAKQAGAKSVVLYDEKMSKQPLETQGKTGATRSKGVATRQAGDALTGGVSILPVEQGVTIMGIDTGSGEVKPSLDAAMISLKNGTTIIEALKNGGQPRVLDVKRFKFQQGIDEFIKKDLKRMLSEMELYSVLMRVSKDDMQDPIIKTLKVDRENFAKAVKSKDYAEIRRTFQQWNDHLDPIGKWELAETF